MSFGKRTWTKTLLSLFVIVLFLLGAFGVPHFGMSMTMDMDGHMAMSGCLMPGMTAICTMTPLEHVAAWQGMFTNALQQFGTVFLLLLISGALMRFSLYALFKPERSGVAVLRARYPDRDHSPLRAAFARGILHSKAF